MVEFRLRNREQAALVSATRNHAARALPIPRDPVAIPRDSGDLLGQFPFANYQPLAYIS